MKIQITFYSRWLGYLIVAAAILSTLVLTGVRAQAVVNHQQIIVRFHSEVDTLNRAYSDQIRSRLQRWQEKFRVTLGYVRPFSKNGWVVVVQERLSPDTLDKVIQQLNQDPQVKYAEIDTMMNISPPQDGFESGLPEGD